jgi:ABC-type methionine transport system ATPase subunit
VRVEDVSFRYTPQAPSLAVDRVSLEVATGEVAAIVGDSGSGKSSLLHLITLIASAVAGEVSILGRATSRLGRRERTRIRGRHLGLIFQDFKLLRATVRENICLPLAIDGERREARERRFRAVMEAVRLPLAYGERRPEQLSGGEQQRVAIARALVRRPEVLTMDEPTAHLDPQNTLNILQLVRGLTESTHHPVTIVWVTHNPELAFEFADAIHGLRGGKLVLHGRRGPDGFTAGFRSRVWGLFNVRKEEA